MKNYVPAFITQISILFFVIMIPAAAAQTFEVTRTDDPPPNGCNSGIDCSLREAIIAANSDHSQDKIIQLIGGQTYNLTITGDIIGNTFEYEGNTIFRVSTNDTEGSLKILNPTRTVRIESTGSQPATIYTENVQIAIMFGKGTSAVLDGIILSGNHEDGIGGILVYNNSDLTIKNSQIINTGHTAIYFEGANATIENSVIADNKGGFGGAGLSISNYADFDGENFVGMVNSDVSIINSTIENNTASIGAGIVIEPDQKLLISGTTIQGNHATQWGGGIFVSGGTVDIYNSSIINNTSRNASGNDGRGAGMFISSGEITLINTTLSGNNVGNGVNSGNGGAIYAGMFSTATMNIINSTITDNSAWQTGGLLWWGGILNIGNTIIANQVKGKDCSIQSQGEEPVVFTSLSHNLESGSSCGFTETGDKQNLNAFLGLLQDNGGPVYTHALVSDPMSPAIDSGSNTLYTNAGGNLTADTDANGNPRVYNIGSGGIIDMGAFEFQGEPGSDPEFAPFITTWKTDHPGNSDDHSIRIPMIGGGYDFTVDWGDGSDPQDHTANPGVDVTHFLEHTYSLAGTYTVSITGDFPRIYFLNADDREKILTVEQWGDIEWTSMQFAFHSTSNFNVVAADAPDLSNVYNMASMFRLAVRMNGDINHWNTETITDMKSMFEDATSFNQNLSKWNTSKVTSMEEMFEDATSFNGDISTWNTGEVQTMREMFKNAASFNGDLGSWQTGSVTSMNQMFDGAAAFNGDIGEWDVRNVSQMGDMFEFATSFNQDITGWQTEALTSKVYMFRGATSFNQDISGWDVSKVRNMWSVFRDATSFNQDLSNWDISGVESMMNMFDNSGMSTRFYDATLTGWAAQAGNSGVQSGVELGAAGLTYCAGADARDILTGGPHNWVISGDTETEACGDPAGAPAIPQLSLPFNNATDVELPVTLQWGAADNAEEYSLQVALDAEFVTIAAEVSSTAGTAFEIAELEAGKIYYWRISSHGNGETSSWSTTWSFEVSTSTSILPDSEIPKVAELLQNYPNPFNPATVISFTLPEVSDVRLEVYNMLGRQVSLLVDERKQPGRHTVTFKAGTLSSGIYIYRLRTGDFVQTRKMLLVK